MTNTKLNTKLKNYESRIKFVEDLNSSLGFDNALLKRKQRRIITRLKSLGRRQKIFNNCWMVLLIVLLMGILPSKRQWWRSWRNATLAKTLIGCVIWCLVNLFFLVQMRGDEDGDGFDELQAMHGGPLDDNWAFHFVLVGCFPCYL